MFHSVQYVPQPQNRPCPLKAEGLSLRCGLAFSPLDCSKSRASNLPTTHQSGFGAPEHDYENVLRLHIAPLHAFDEL